MDVTQALRDTENSLRDFIALTLSKKLGGDWINQSGVSEERFQKWNERKEAEKKRHPHSTIEERLIYYADFYDLKTILKKHWVEFSSAFGELKKFEIFLSELEKYRDADAHRRELLPHQKNLILGIAGEIRTQIVRYRSMQEKSSDDYFPMIESVRDNFGNIWIPEDRERLKIINTKMNLRPEDELNFTITATDPEDRSLQFGYRINGGKKNWYPTNSFSFRIEKSDIGKVFSVESMIISDRDYHAHTGYDDSVSFMYSVVPRK